MSSELSQAINYFLNNYITAQKNQFANNEVGDFIRNQTPQLFFNSKLINSQTYKIKASVGQSKWADVPWLCIFNKSVTESAQNGIYIAYLLAKDGNSLFVTLNQGSEDFSKEHSRQETIEYMRKTALAVQDIIDPLDFKTDRNISLGTDISNRAHFYEEGTILYKKYVKNNVPSEDELRKDLSNLIKIYETYIQKSNSETTCIPDGLSNQGVKEMSVERKNLEHIKSYINSKGFSYNDDLIENFYLCLKSKPFVILAGTSGTGKTRLTKLFAEAIGATEDNGQYKLVSVRPDWSDSSDLFGHVNLNDKFVPGAIIDFVKNAAGHKDKPYFLSLDEMNLARVEYYLSDFLSIMETRNFEKDTKNIKTTPLLTSDKYGKDDEAKLRYGSLGLPENLYIVGTVNMDETTFPFSKKVLDRANTIEFSFVNLIPEFDNTKSDVDPITLENNFLKTDYIILQDCEEENFEYIKNISGQLEEINQKLINANLHVGYRVRDEICFYMLNNKKAELLKEDEAFDNEIMQKILPRIQGSSMAIKEVLCDLFKYCVGDHTDLRASDSNTVGDLMIKKTKENNKIKYKKSASKIAFMVRRFEEDGFTSYWL